ncbi:tyrosine-type recombinase/integrase [Myxococcota bacterium]|nr:tyrosine-type recombinase/integrase [Myxococcota bacterium]
MFCHFATEDENQRFEGFEARLAARGRSAATRRAYRSDWQDLSLFLRRERGAAFDGALSAEALHRWCDYARKHAKRAATINRRLAFARVYARHLSEAGVISPAQAEAIQAMPRFCAPPRAARLGEAEIHRLLAQVDARGCSRDQALIYTLLDTGLKASDLAEMDVEDVDFAAGCLWPKRRRLAHPMPTRAARKIAWSLGERGLLALPDSGEIVLPASGGWPPSGRLPPPPPERLPRALRSPMPLDDEGAVAGWPLFVGERGRLTENAIQRIVRTHGAFARVKVTPRGLRDAFALHHWRAHQDLVGLAELLDLSSLDGVRQLIREATREDHGDDALSA